MYIKLVSGTPEEYSIRQLRLDNPQVSFPKNPLADLLAEYDVYLVKTMEVPKYSEKETLVEGGYVQLKDNTWVKEWHIRQLTEEELKDVYQQKEEEQRYAYQNESDPLFFKWQRGEVEKQVWLDKVAEIKARHG